MIQEKKIEALKIAANEIMENGDSFTLRKSFDSVDIDLIDRDWAKKVYKSRAVLRRYASKHLPFWGITTIIFFLLLLMLCATISTNYFYRRFGIDTSFFNNGYMFFGLFILYLYLNVKLLDFIRKMYFKLNWKKIHNEFEMIKVDSSFLQNQFGSSKEFLEIISVIADKLAEEEFKKYREY